MSETMTPTWRPAIHGGQSGFIVELFGPAACGKTTLGRALEGELKAGGYPVHLIASSRPRERNPRQTRAAAALTAPLSRASKLFTALGAFAPGGPTEPLVQQLIEILPPKGWISLLRARRYLRNLCRSWNDALTSQDVVIFDQGFMNSLCSLALYSCFDDRHSLARGLSLLPVPDLLVRVDTPREVLKARLEKRLRHLGAIERPFEREIDSALRQFELSSCLDDLLAERGRHSLHVSWSDRDGLKRAVQTLIDEIMSKKKGSST